MGNTIKDGCLMQGPAYKRSMGPSPVIGHTWRARWLELEIESGKILWYDTNDSHSRATSAAPKSYLQLSKDSKVFDLGGDRNSGEELMAGPGLDAETLALKGPCGTAANTWAITAGFIRVTGTDGKKGTPGALVFGFESVSSGVTLAYGSDKSAAKRLWLEAINAEIAYLNGGPKPVPKSGGGAGAELAAAIAGATAAPVTPFYPTPEYLAAYNAQLAGQKALSDLAAKEAATSDAATAYATLTPEENARKNEEIMALCRMALTQTEEIAKAGATGEAAKALHNIYEQAFASGGEGWVPDATVTVQLQTMRTTWIGWGGDPGVDRIALFLAPKKSAAELSGELTAARATKPEFSAEVLEAAIEYGRALHREGRIPEAIEMLKDVYTRAFAGRPERLPRGGDAARVYDLPAQMVLLKAQKIHEDIERWGGDPGPDRTNAALTPNVPADELLAEAHTKCASLGGPANDKVVMAYTVACRAFRCEERHAEALYWTKHALAAADAAMSVGIGPTDSSDVEALKMSTTALKKRIIKWETFTLKRGMKAYSVADPFAFMMPAAAAPAMAPMPVAMGAGAGAGAGAGGTPDAAAMAATQAAMAQSMAAQQAAMAQVQMAQGMAMQQAAMAQAAMMGGAAAPGGMPMAGMPATSMPMAGMPGATMPMMGATAPGMMMAPGMAPGVMAPGTMPAAAPAVPAAAASDPPADTKDS